MGSEDFGPVSGVLVVRVWVFSHPVSAVGTFFPESRRVDCVLVVFGRGACCVGSGISLTCHCDLFAGVLAGM